MPPALPLLLVFFGSELPPGAGIPDEAPLAAEDDDAEEDALPDLPTGVVRPEARLAILEPFLVVPGLAGPAWALSADLSLVPLVRPRLPPVVLLATLLMLVDEAVRLGMDD